MNRYNPEKHNRRSIRLKGYDYSQEGSYFITMCCDKRAHKFGKIVNGKMMLNEYGQIAHDEWVHLSERFPNFRLEAFQIMPNHMHGIISLTSRSNFDRVDGECVRSAPTIPDIIRVYKSLVTKKCLEIFKEKNKIMGKIWQRNYYEHIIRDEKAYQNIERYIINNPLKWEEDKFYGDNRIFVKNN